MTKHNEGAGDGDNRPRTVTINLDQVSVSEAGIRQLRRSGAKIKFVRTVTTGGRLVTRGVAAPVFVHGLAGAAADAHRP